MAERLLLSVGSLGVGCSFACRWSSDLGGLAPRLPAGTACRHDVGTPPAQQRAAGLGRVRPHLPSRGGLLLLARKTLSQMDVPTRQALWMGRGRPPHANRARRRANAARYNKEPSDRSARSSPVLQHVALGAPLLVDGSSSRVRPGPVALGSRALPLVAASGSSTRIPLPLPPASGGVLIVCLRTVTCPRTGARATFTGIDAWREIRENHLHPPELVCDPSVLGGPTV